MCISMKSVVFLNHYLKYSCWVSTLWKLYHILFRQDIQLNSKCWAVKRTLFVLRDQNDWKNNNKWCHVQTTNSMRISWPTDWVNKLTLQMEFSELVMHPKEVCVLSHRGLCYVDIVFCIFWNWSQCIQHVIDIIIYRLYIDINYAFNNHNPESEGHSLNDVGGLKSMYEKPLYLAWIFL